MQTKPLKNDPLLCEFNLPLKRVYHPYGFSLEIVTNSREALLAAEENWGCFRKMFHDPAVQMRIGVVEGGGTACPAIPVFRGRGNLVAAMADRQNFGACDLREGTGFCWLSNAAVKNRGYLRYHFLEAMPLMLLESKYWTPLHAGCVSRNGHGVLLCAESGGGKSSLSFACARRGWTFVSDDSCYILRKRSDRLVIGNPYRLRFRETAKSLFPELKQLRLIRHNGEMTIELETAALPSIATSAQCSVDYVVFLNRQSSGKAAISNFPKKQALQFLGHVVCYGEQTVQDAQIASLHNLLTAEVLELRYSDLDSAVIELETMIRDRSEESGISPGRGIECPRASST